MEKQLCFYCRKPSPWGLTHTGCKGDIDGLFVFTAYKGPIRKIIHAVKYDGIFAAIPELASMVINSYHQKFEFDYLVPVPLSKQRQAERGFNQTEKIAKIVGKKLGIESSNLLERIRNTKPQFDLSQEEREINVKDAFYLSSRLKSRHLKGLSFCLVDDVMTSGATLSYCAKVLKLSGADKIYALTIAHG